MKRSILLLVLLLLLLVPRAAQAHVLLTDDTKSMGAILHINPDDDPVAGGTTSLFFELENNLASGGVSSYLDIVNEAGTYASLRTTGNGKSLSAQYVFPAQGLYTIVLTISPHNTDTSYTFHYAQAVNRGTASVSSTNSQNSSAELGLIVSGSLLLVLFILAFNRRRNIILHSQ